MRIRLTKIAAVAAIVAFATSLIHEERSSRAADERTTGPMLAHMVFFTLKERTPENRDKLVAACKKYLADHPGTVYFSAGKRVEELDREVNDKEFDVALHVVFKDKAAHDVYQEAPTHIQFINENRDSWAKVRVFDSYVTE